MQKNVSVKSWSFHWSYKPEIIHSQDKLIIIIIINEHRILNVKLAFDIDSILIKRIFTN